MTAQRIHLFGASGSGTTTLGRAIAERLGYPHFDDDDYRWLPTAVPYQQLRDKKERSRLLLKDLQRHRQWVLSGSVCGWGAKIRPLFDLAVFLYVPTATRLERLQRREVAKHGSTLLKPGGALYDSHQRFMEWAASYNSGSMKTRSLKLHQNWIRSLACDVLQLNGDRPLAELVQAVLERASG